MTTVDRAAPRVSAPSPSAPPLAVPAATAAAPQAPEALAAADEVVPYREPGRIELEQPFAAEPDGGRLLEVAMAAVIFSDLQAGGYIDRNATLASPVAAQEGFAGKTYESRLVALITDADQNGKLDLDLERLAESGLLSRPATPAQLERALGGGAPHDGLPDDFIRTKGGDPKSELTEYRAPNDRGRAVEYYAINMTLSTEADRATRAAIEGAGARARKSPEAAARVAADTIQAAQGLRARGDAAHASMLLDGTGAELTRAGRFEDARSVFGALASAPNAGDAVNLARSARTPDAGYDAERRTFAVRREGTNTSIDERDFDTTWKGVAEQRLAQVDQAERMAAVLQRTVDPQDLGAAREYFGKLSQFSSSAAIASEYRDYLQANFVHSGIGVEWSKAIPEAERPARAAELLREQPVDALGRKVIDCEGFAALTDHLFRGQKDASGADRFSIQHAGHNKHVIAGVFEKKGGGGFITNNANTTVVPEDVTGPAARRESLARSLSNGFYNVLAFGDDPASARVENRSPPLGSFIWQGDRFGGRVDEEFLRRRRGGEGFGLSLSEFVGKHYSGE